MPHLNIPSHKHSLPRDLLIVLGWLLFLALINQKSKFPIYSIIPYVCPVIFLSWRHGVAWGLICSAVATLAAIPGNYPLEHPDSFYWAGFTTYLKLTSAVAGVMLGKRIVERESKL